MAWETPHIIVAVSNLGGMGRNEAYLYYYIKYNYFPTHVVSFKHIKTQIETILEMIL